MLSHGANVRSGRLSHRAVKSCSLDRLGGPRGRAIWFDHPARAANCLSADDPADIVQACRGARVRSGLMAEGDFFTESTVGYWQELAPDVPAPFSAPPPSRFGYPPRLPDGRVLVLPLRQLRDGRHAVASLIANQASHDVVSALADHMAEQAQHLAPEIIVGLPTLGLAFASLVAARLGQLRFVPLGYSRKFWYDDALSVPISSITTPEAGRRLRLDPHLLTLIKGRRVVVIDDA